MEALIECMGRGDVGTFVSLLGTVRMSAPVCACARRRRRLMLGGGAVRGPRQPERGHGGWVAAAALCSAVG
jgi:hypothetical protein